MDRKGCVDEDIHENIQKAVRIYAKIYVVTFAKSRKLQPFRYKYIMTLSAEQFRGITFIFCPRIEKIGGLFCFLVYY